MMKIVLIIMAFTLLFLTACTGSPTASTVTITTTYAQTTSTTGPIPVFPSSFDAIGYNLTSISLTWVKDPLATTTYIRGKVGSYPANQADGSLVYNGTANSYYHTGFDFHPKLLQIFHFRFNNLFG